MELKKLKEKLLSDKAFRKEYETYDLAFEIGEMVIDARVKKGLTQEALAELVDTKQSSIARLENGNNLPSLSFLERIAKKLGTYLIAPRFAFLDNGGVNSKAVSESYVQCTYPYLTIFSARVEIEELSKWKMPDRNTEMWPSFPLVPETYTSSHEESANQKVPSVA